MKINDIANEVVKYLLTLPEGTEISTTAAMAKVYCSECMKGTEFIIEGKIISDSELFDVDNKIHTVAKKNGLILDRSRFDGMDVGLPYNLAYIIKHKK